MAGLMTIELTGLRFHAFHGLYEEEKNTGNEFEVNAYISFHSSGHVINDLSGTVNYAGIYEIIYRMMQQRTDLLETLAMSITEKIYHTYPVVHKVDIAITKLHPPISGFTGNVGVRYQKEFR